jgi:hypothetical protein
MEEIQCYETLAYTPDSGESPEESIQHLEHGKSLKSGIFFVVEDFH